MTVESGDGPGTLWTYRLSSPLAGVSAYAYEIGDVKRTVEAGADGTATFTYTPAEAGEFFVHSRARTAAGMTSGLNSDYFIAAAAE